MNLFLSHTRGVQLFPVVVFQGRLDGRDSADRLDCAIGIVLAEIHIVTKVVSELEHGAFSTTTK